MTVLSKRLTSNKPLNRRAVENAVKQTAMALGTAGHYRGNPPRRKKTQGLQANAVLMNIVRSAETVLPSLYDAPLGRIIMYRHMVKKHLFQHIDTNSELRFPLVMLIDNGFSTVEDEEEFGIYQTLTSGMSTLLLWVLQSGTLEILLQHVLRHIDTEFPGIEQQVASYSSMDVLEGVYCQRWLQFVLLYTLRQTAEEYELDDNAPWGWQEPMIYNAWERTLTDDVESLQYLVGIARESADADRRDEAAAFADLTEEEQVEHELLMHAEWESTL